MSTLLLIIVVVLLLGGSGFGYVRRSNWAARPYAYGGGWIVGLGVFLILVWLLLGHRL
jgi:hypothetical protein